MRLLDAGIDDLGPIYDVWYATEVEGLADPPPPRTMPWFGHLREVGRLVVAVEARAGHGGREEVVGFAGALDHGRCVALSDLFVRPDRQSRGIGGALLDEMLPPGRPLVTMASADPRAVALYARRGLRPRWPVYYLAASPAQLRSAVWPDRHVAPLLPELYPWPLRGDAAHYEGLDARPLVVRDEGREIGTALVVTGSPQRLAHPGATELLESSAHHVDDAAALVLAVVRHLVEAGARRVIVQVPGPHGALASLLARGFAITDTDMACATEPDLLADPARHTMHGESRIARQAGVGD